MDSENHDQLTIFFLPFVAAGHMIPLINIARLFATRPRVKVNIITTTHNALLFKTSIDQDIDSGRQIQLHILRFPFEQVGLPEGVENLATETPIETFSKIYHGLSKLKPEMETLIRDNKPDCIISDIFYPWTTDLALQLGCPRIVFNGSNFFSYFSSKVPELPEKREMVWGYENIIIDAEKRSYGNIINSFYELEPFYIDHFRSSTGRKAWHIGPVSLFVQREEKERKKHECLIWLDSMKPKSVVYVSFGSLTRFPKAQLVEIAAGLEAYGHPFIWVSKEHESTSKEEEGEERWLLPDEGYFNNKGMIIRGWAPQVEILEHPAIGGFMTHCGWNSVLESVVAGVPMITWPLFADQFNNEKLITQYLKIGVPVGAEEYTTIMEVGKVPIKSERIKKVMTQFMDGDEIEEMRKRTKELGEKAKRAMEKGGSSYASLSDLIEDLRNLRCIGNNNKSNVN